MCERERVCVYVREREGRVCERGESECLCVREMRKRESVCVCNILCVR